MARLTMCNSSDEETVAVFICVAGIAQEVTKRQRKTQYAAIPLQKESVDGTFSPVQTLSGAVSFARWGRTGNLAAECPCPRQAAGRTKGTGTWPVWRGGRQRSCSRLMPDRRVIAGWLCSGAASHCRCPHPTPLPTVPQWRDLLPLLEQLRPTMIVTRVWQLKLYIISDQSAVAFCWLQSWKHWTKLISNIWYQINFNLFQTWAVLQIWTVLVEMHTAIVSQNND